METFWNIIQEGDQFTCGNQVFEISSIYRNRDPACLYVYELVDGKRENGQTIYKWWLNPVSGLLIQTGWKHVPKQTTNDIKGNSG
ncbi:hypothetical protein [Spirosoma terrae]|uniref:Uncharacterized protein n=1 Tax=Spirosoma terrae TaxID=1968276 RepID=A0A6L9LBD2_9BACT|nr:hypothetical protein [Spirosoma terrae]NDU95768.1 hypothetical protein [Spirosoma terrae]